MRTFIILFLIFWATTSIAQSQSTLSNTSNPDVWQPVAESICSEVKLAATLYQKGEVKEAKLKAIMSYFKGYDEAMEPAVRITIGGSHVFATEQQFRQFSAVMASDVTSAQIKIVNDLAKTLCAGLYTDAKVLHAEKVKREVFKVE
jgi:hypothetical protein